MTWALSLEKASLPGAEAHKSRQSCESSEGLLPAISETGGPISQESAASGSGAGGGRDDSGRKETPEKHLFNLASPELPETGDEATDDEDGDTVSVLTESQLGLDDYGRPDLSIDVEGDRGENHDDDGGGGDDGNAPGHVHGAAAGSEQGGTADARLSPPASQDTSAVTHGGASIDGAESEVANSVEKLTSKASAAGGTGSVTAAAAASTAASATVKASGPGAAARDQGWSDRELLLGLLQPEDSPVIAVHDVSRSIGGVEVKRGLFLVCRGALYFIAGFGRGPPRRPGAGGGGGAGGGRAVASGGKGVADSSKDPLQGVRRLEEWELGGGAGGIGGGDDGEASTGAKIQVTLRRRSAQEAGGAGGAPRDAGKGGVGRSLTTEQAGGTRGRRGKGEREVDGIVSLGRVAVQRVVLDQVCVAAVSCVHTCMCM